MARHNATGRERRKEILSLTLLVYPGEKLTYTVDTKKGSKIHIFLILISKKKNSWQTHN